ncbi:MAG: hypothetical protein KAV87_03855 [Desulfobacteraceae bacterium]|nr:hypothetical protein [Desulfobacteraceae bacterium]
MESETRVCLTIMSVFTVFLPLLWTWIRSALWLMEQIEDHRVQNARRWFWITSAVGSLTYASIIGLAIFGCGNLRESGAFSPDSEIFYPALALTTFFAAITLAVIWVWIAIRVEFVEKLDRMGM